MLRKKYMIFLLIILVASVFSVRLSSNFLKYTSNTEASPDKTIELFDLKSSGPQINITTPENKTYIEPMSGYYPATYGFENDIVGSFPNEWDEIVGSGCAVDIKDLEGEHENVVRIYDNDLTYNAVLNNQFQNQTTGTIEWWVKKSSGDTGCYFLFYGGNDFDIANRAIDFGIDAGNNGAFAVRDDGQWVFDYSHIDGTWYHLKVEFDCTNYNFTVYKNGVPLFVNVSFWAKMDTINLMAIGTNTFRAGTFYTDAIGYSWDLGYNIGDNLNEGLLLSYDTSFTPDWQGYSLDAQANYTILGNTTIPLPTNEGVHSIQVFGNNSIGTNFQSDIRYFSIKHIEMITPENKTYAEPMSGYYPASYGFENDEVDSVPFGWTDESVGPTWVKVIASEDGHNNVLQLYDTSGGDPYAINAIGNKEYGTVEFWMKNVDMTERAYFAPRNGPTHLFRVLLADNMVTVTAQSGTGYDLAAATADTWHHFSVDFECGTGGYKGLGQYEFYVTYNGIRYGPYNFWGNAPYAIDTVFSGFYGSGNYYYVDAVGYSWDPDYSIGDNLDEGLLVSFDLGFNPDWLGYSLDSQTNKTILGNTTIPIPSEGFHTIQIFGNHSSSTLYESEIRYFSIDLPPRININKPSQNDIFGLIAPSFNITIDDLFLNTTWYTLDNGITNITFTGLTGIINQTEWDKQISSSVTIQFYANDTIGREDFEEVIVLKDTIAPILTINIPDQDEFYADTPPSFDITIDDLSLNTTWYTLDNGNNNFTFTGLIGTVEHTVWDNIAEGPVTIRFYANDTFDYRNYAEITIYKDTTDPILTINNPSSGLSFTALPPAYNIEVEEINLESIWYTIDGGLNNFEITELTGYIDSNAWNAAPNGAITIRFYAEDKAGNLVYNDIIVQKSTPLPPLDINLVIIIVAIVSIIGVAVLGGLVYRKKHVRIKKLRLEVGEVEKSARPKRTKRAKTKKEPSLVEQPIFSCPFCQAELPGDQKYCFYCGAKLKE